MPEAAVGWGILGFGWVAQDYMAPAIAAAGDRLIAVADPDPAARDAASRQGARAHADIAALVADPAVEAVYVATPNHLHAPAVEALAASGKAVLCEKPMATRLADARRMVAACRNAGVLYGTAFDQRHHPAHRAMREMVRAGAIGRPTALRIVYACWLGADWSDGSGRENWRIDGAKAGGGALIDLAPHGLDLAGFLLDEPIAEMTGFLQSRVQDYAVDDGGMLVGRTRSGILASLHVAYNYPEGLPRRRLEIVGTAAMLTAENTMGQDAGGIVTRIDGRTGTAEPIRFADTSPFVEQVRAFGAALRAGETGEFSGERDLDNMALIEAVYPGTGPREHLSPSGRGRAGEAGRVRGSELSGEGGPPHPVLSPTGRGFPAAPRIADAGPDGPREPAAR